MEQTIFIQLTKEELLNLISDEVSKALETKKPKEHQYYTRDEVCSRLRITLCSLHNYIKQGKIEALKIGGRTLFDATKIDEAIEKKIVLRYGRA